MKYISFFVIIFLSQLASKAQSFQFGFSGGPALLYMDEDRSSWPGTNNYYEGLMFQADFVHLNESRTERYGYTFYSNSIDTYGVTNGREFFKGRITNTGLYISKYFTKQLKEKLSTNLQLGVGPNLETQFFGATKLFLNINLSTDLKYEILPDWFLVLKGTIMGQDVPNLVRFVLYDEWVEAGEDIHLMLLFGIATNIGKR